MIGWILAAIGTYAVCKAVSDVKNETSTQSTSLYRADNTQQVIESQQREISYLRQENRMLKLTMHNHSQLLRNYDKVNRFAKEQGYRGAVDFFYMLAEEHDSRFEHLARFLCRVRHTRNDVAHNGTIYQIDQNFLDKLEKCWEVCLYYQRMPYGRRLRLN